MSKVKVGKRQSTDVLIGIGLPVKFTFYYESIFRPKMCNEPIKIPFKVKKVANLFVGLNTRPQPETSPWPFQSGSMAPTGHSK
jgi:hypothetical protein